MSRNHGNTRQLRNRSVDTVNSTPKTPKKGPIDKYLGTPLSPCKMSASSESSKPCKCEEMLASFETRLLSMVQKTIKDEVKTFKDEVETFKNDIKERFEYCDKEVKDLAERVTNVESKASQAEANYGKVKEEMFRQEKTSEHSLEEIYGAIEDLERYTREYNIRVTGMDEDMDENCTEKVAALIAGNNLAGYQHKGWVVNEIETAHRIGPKLSRPGGKKRQIIVRFYSRPVRNAVLRDAKRLLKSSRYHIYEDLTPKDFELKMRASTQMKEAYSSGKRVKFNKGKLYIDGKDTQIRERQSTVEYNSMICFWTKESPYSNHHNSACFINGTQYPTAEHYIMVQKANEFNDKDTASQIMATNDPGQAKKLGRQVRNFDNEKWKEVSDVIVETAVRAKFTQNQVLHDILISSGDKILVEASPVDRYWGVGLAANDLKIQDQANWNGKNKLGSILMSLRDSLGQTEGGDG